MLWKRLLSEYNQDTLQEEDILSLRKTLSQDKGEFSIVGVQELDSLKSQSWRSYLKRERLLEAWSPPSGSPYSKFFKTKTINSIEFISKKIKPRYSKGETKSQKELDNLIKSGILDKYTAIILDSGGPHSVAMAVTLANCGFQPVIMLDGIPHSKGLVRSEQSLAVLLYFADEMNRLKRERRIKPDAPPVFVLDAHRIAEIQLKGYYDNTYAYTEDDFPSVEFLKKLGIKKIVYLNEGDQHGEIRQKYQSIERLNNDLKPIVEKWIQAGIKIFYTGIQPWDNIDNFYDLFQKS